jgi:uridine phosphorylase
MSATQSFLALYKTLLGVKLTKNTPPLPPYGSKPTLAKVKTAVDGGAPFLPPVYRDGYAAALQSHLASLVSRTTRSGDLTSLQTLTGAVYQHNQAAAPQLDRFLAVVSNLFRSFLDKTKRSNVGVPLVETLPPLAMFQFEGADGPFTITAEQVNSEISASVGVVSLPAAYRDHPFLWTSLSHETGGHDVTHADTDLLPELGQAAIGLFAGSDPAMGQLWSYWIDEASADVYGILNMGPTFGFNLAVFFSALLAQLQGVTSAPPTLRTQSGADDAGRLDVHPTDILRLHLALGVVESLVSLSNTAKDTYTAQLLELAGLLCPKGVTTVELQGSMELADGSTKVISSSFPLVEMQDHARRVGALIATAKLKALGGHSIQDIETWDDADEAKALQISGQLESNKAVTGIGDDAQLLAGFNLAMISQPALYQKATALIAAGLDESFAKDPYWGSAKPDQALMLNRRKFTVTPPAPDIDQLAVELIGYDSREDSAHVAAIAANMAPIPWPAGQAPKPVALKNPQPSDPLPKCDYLAVTWTVDEANSMAKLLTPGIVATAKKGSTEPAWYPYASNYAAMQKLISSPIAPSSQSHMLGRYYMTQFGNQKVLCFKSEMHVSTDGSFTDSTGQRMPPLLKLFQQIIVETGAKLVVTTGTAGAIGTKVKLGDVIVAPHCRFDCGRTFKAASFNGKTFSSDPVLPDKQLTLANAKLLAANASQLHPQRVGVPQIFWSDQQLGQGQPDAIVTTDFFAFDNAQDTYQLQGLGSAVEMDDAVLGLACSMLPASQQPKWVAIRNASDPQMDGTTLAQEKSDAAAIYKKYGFWTTVSSVIATWAVISGQ